MDEVVRVEEIPGMHKHCRQQGKVLHSMQSVVKTGKAMHAIIGVNVEKVLRAVSVIWWGI